ncbi:hypothetical protein COO60DRAFT_1229190 [Scenedesmus sp. NREL 46B-D3]|nr:hypothetical protein COO60DRAFT_1229190 [Scenedesmus sp. NREL 46B-D3]
MIDRQAAIGGSSRLSRGSKGSRHSTTLLTPADKAISAATTPQNTPMDVEAEHYGDQQMLLPASPTVAAPVVAVGSNSGTPASVSFAGTCSPAAAAAAATPGAGVRLATPVQQLGSPADSHASEVSIGSICTPAGVLSAANVSARRLDFTDAVNNMDEAAAGSVAAIAATSPQRQEQQQGGYRPGFAVSELLPTEPMSLEELAASMQSSATKAAFALEMPEVGISIDGDLSFDVNKFLKNRDDEYPSREEKASATSAAHMAVAAAAPKRSGLLGKSRSLLLWLLAGLALVATSFVVVEKLPQTLAPPVCFEHNLNVCHTPDQALNKVLSRQPSGWRLAVKQTAWYLQDAADVLLRRRLPQGVTADDFSRVWINSVSDEQWRSVPIEAVAALFAAVPQHLWPRAVMEKLQGSEGAAAQLKQQRQAAPENVAAASSPEAATAAAADSAAAAAAAPAEAMDCTVPAAAVNVIEEQPAEQQAEGDVSSMPIDDEAATPEPAAPAEPVRQEDAAAKLAQEPAPATAAAEVAGASEPAAPAEAVQQEDAVAEVAATPEPAGPAEAVQQEDAAANMAQEPAAATAAAEVAVAPEPAAPAEAVQQEDAAAEVAATPEPAGPAEAVQQEDAAANMAQEPAAATAAAEVAVAPEPAAPAEAVQQEDAAATWHRSLLQQQQPLRWQSPQNQQHLPRQCSRRMQLPMWHMSLLQQ